MSDQKRFLLVSGSRIPHPPLTSRSSSTGLADSDVLPSRVRMSKRTRRFCRVGSRAWRSKILTVCHGAQMIWIDARRNPTKVVDLQATRDSAPDSLIRNPMSESHRLFPAESKETIAESVFRGSPNPTTRVRLDKPLLIEPLPEWNRPRPGWPPVWSAARPLHFGQAGVSHERF